ncbi:MAG: cysteine--tRNA ligase [Parcubacteria bacterium C7867-004]|nr:MAG: cysteine--tRNA ligase [Parcubacteria bacterium C7867-004]
MSWFSTLFARKPQSAKSNAPIFFSNTLTGTKDLFSPLRAGTVLMYSCGPTVYSKQHIGNLKAPLFADLVARVLAQAGYRVKRVINITDVGHLQSNGDEGEDKMEVGAKREGLHASDIAERYALMFIEDIQAIGLDTNDIKFPRATDYIEEQIAMVKSLEERGYTYRTHDGIYFDTSKFPSYGKLGHVQPTHSREEALAGIGRRITENKEKRQAADFALWKFSPHGTKREQEWPSPWGVGFPGWHIECSAMAKALLGSEIDIHTGGIDHIPVHHNNEIAQSEVANGKPLARFWMHEAFVNVADEKISKSLGNDVYLSDIIDRGFHPLSLRYFFLQAHYRTSMSFTWDALEASNEALTRLWKLCAKVREETKGPSRPSDTSRRMIAILREDLATPQALALLWETVKDEDMERSEQLAVIEAAEAVLGLSLLEGRPPVTEPIPEHIQALVEEREQARLARDFGKADALRIHIEGSGYHVEDGPSGAIVTRR